MIGKLLTEHHLEYLRLIGGCAGSFEFTLVKLPHCWNSIIVILKLTIWKLEALNLKVILSEYVYIKIVTIN